MCRSPYVAALLRKELPDLVIASAGTSALTGETPTPQVRALLLERGLSEVLPLARPLRRGLVKGARLILTAGRAHRVEATRLSPVAADRAFTLLELTRFLRAADYPMGLGVDGVLELAHRAASLDDQVDHSDDLADPYGGSESDYAAMAASADAALAVIVPALRTTPT